jgi:hypothetical protein
MADWTVNAWTREDLEQASGWLPPKVVWDPEGE